MLRSSFCKSIITLLILSAVCLGQIPSGGSIGGGGSVLGGGKAEAVLQKEVTSVFNKKIFTGLGQKTTKTNSTPKNVSSTKGSTKLKNTTAKNSKTAVSKTPATLTSLNFKPLGDTGFDQELAEILSQKADEQAILLTIFRETKKAYNLEARKLGRENDIALATTFFITACIMVYHQTPDPSDEATEALYNSMAESMLKAPETAQMSNQDKQLTSDKLVYLGGLILSGYLISKQSGNQQTMQAYRQIAASFFQAFTNLDVKNYEFSATGLKLKS